MDGNFEALVDLVGAISLLDHSFGELAIVELIKHLFLLSLLLLHVRKMLTEVSVSWGQSTRSWRIELVLFSSHQSLKLKRLPYRVDVDDAVFLLILMLIAISKHIHPVVVSVIDLLLELFQDLRLISQGFSDNVAFNLRGGAGVAARSDGRDGGHFFDLCVELVD